MFCHFWNHIWTQEDHLLRTSSRENWAVCKKMQSKTLESHLSFELNSILKFEVLVCFFLDYQFVVDRGEGVTGPKTWQWQAPQFGQFYTCNKKWDHIYWTLNKIQLNQASRTYWGWLDVYSLWLPCLGRIICAVEKLLFNCSQHFWLTFFVSK